LEGGVFTIHYQVRESFFRLNFSLSAKSDLKFKILAAIDLRQNLTGPLNKIA